MCGIVGYVGTRNAAEIIVDGLRRLEYRGYDSAGLAVVDGDRHPAGARCGPAAESGQECHGGVETESKRSP
jgi:glutamine---fructose-6-phosphate transaminase (isomerizing)